MKTSKRYVKTLFIILFMIVTTTVGYSIYFSKNYPVPIIDHISFDAKIQFIREHIDIDKIDTIVVGSSLALNNVQGIILEENSKVISNVLNFSVWSVDAPQVEQMLELTSNFPNVKRIIYSGQFTSFNFGRKFKNFDTDFIRQYMTHQLNPIEEKKFILNACKDISFCMKRQNEWKEKYGSNRLFSYLDFDHTGSAPLHIYGKDIIESRWTRADGAVQNPNGHKALARIAKKAQDKNIKFYFVQQPYRQEMIEKHENVKRIIKDFSGIITSIIGKFNGKFLNLHETLHLDDTHFADRSHLNDKGSKLGSKEIAKFIDRSEIN